jgi:hypothetical protein
MCWQSLKSSVYIVERMRRYTWWQLKTVSSLVFGQWNGKNIAIWLKSITWHYFETQCNVIFLKHGKKLIRSHFAWADGRSCKEVIAACLKSDSVFELRDCQAKMHGKGNVRCSPCKEFFVFVHYLDVGSSFCPYSCKIWTALRRTVALHEDFT